MLAVANWVHPVLRVRWQLANALAFLLLMLLPASAVSRALDAMGGWKLLLWLVPTVSLAAVGGFLAFLTTFEVARLLITGHGAAMDPSPN